MSDGKSRLRYFECSCFERGFLRSGRGRKIFHPSLFLHLCKGVLSQDIAFAISFYRISRALAPLRRRAKSACGFALPPNAHKRGRAVGGRRGACFEIICLLLRGRHWGGRAFFLVPQKFFAKGAAAERALARGLICKFGNALAAKAANGPLRRFGTRLCRIA